MRNKEIRRFLFAEFGSAAESREFQPERKCHSEGPLASGRDYSNSIESCVM